MRTMRKLAGYALYRASRVLWFAASDLIDNADSGSAPFIAKSEFRADQFVNLEVTLFDVAPRLAAAVEAIGDRVQHATWLASIVGLERMTKENDSA